ncbi:class I SAM-dependent methyltransferase [Candidatus Woesearchaeota archaeon]|nr:class I SAM-dependent methyltransferase [Candidatus Woesearchaeota archaeon]
MNFTFQLYLIKNINLDIIRIIKIDEDYKNYYNHIAKNYESFVPHEKEIGSILLNFYKELNISKEIKILDLGAGTGIVAEELVKNGFKDITLLDISKNELDIARSKKILKNIKVIEADLTKTKILGRYDSIIETMVFNELNNSELFKILTNIKNALKKNGLFIMIDRHLIDGLDKFFTELKKGKIKIKTPEGIFDFYFYIGKN